jgi:uncharacterized protein (TIGR03546 family)
VLTLLIVKLLGFLTAPPLDLLGWEILHIEGLQTLFTQWYNMPFVPFTKFNNTLVAGGLAAGIILWIPVFLLFLALIPFYRNVIAVKIRSLKIFQAIAKIPFFSAISKAVSNLAQKG